MYQSKIPAKYLANIPAEGFTCQTPEELLARLGCKPEELEFRYVGTKWEMLGHADCVDGRVSLWPTLKLAGQRQAAKQYANGFREGNAHRIANDKSIRRLA
jgi:hypothetical protein